MKRKIYSILLFLLTLKLDGIACEACRKQQPGSFGDLGHGPGPDSQWDYLIVWVMVAITVYVLAATLKCFVRPGEKQAGHIKRMILNELSHD